MVVLNGKRYAKNNKELIDSLFAKGGTCCGFYKRQGPQVKLFNLQRKPILNGKD